jgi:predicted MPP superfamily phosphohydrolase
MSRFVLIGTILAILVAVEFYIYFALRSTFRTGWMVRAVKVGYFISLGVELAAIATIFTIFSGGYGRSNFWVNLLMGTGFILLVCKLMLSVFFLVDDLVRLLQWLFKKGTAVVGSDPDPVVMPGRRKFVGQLGIVVASIPFAGAIYGMVKGKYDFTLHHETLRFSDLPEAFDGMRIVQISDIHAGTFDSIAGVEAGIGLIAAQKPDLILFTGDLVNNLATEADPYIELFAGLSAPMGKFSCLGNHDYGHYYRFDSEAEKMANQAAIRTQNARMGFRLLNNAHVRIEKEGQSLVLAGVENWGAPPFPKYGDLDAAFDGVADHDFTLLMSHDPSHWDGQIRGHKKHVHVTFSGHTHGAQFGVEIPGVKWSPAQWRYQQWAGLYTEGRQHLYVNRGFGHIGFPGRIGIWPEVTLIELRKG